LIIDTIINLQVIDEMKTNATSRWSVKL
jgi:hypothetical protein